MRKGLNIFFVGALLGAATVGAAPFVHKHYLHSQEVEQLIKDSRATYVDIGFTNSSKLEPQLIDLCVQNRAECEKETYSLLTDNRYLVCEYEDFHNRCDEHTKRAEIAKKVRKRFGFM
jgi:acyl-coenzyme A synthetase/AMP-(fatty) acid ligase